MAHLSVSQSFLVFVSEPGCKLTARFYSLSSTSAFSRLTAYYNTCYQGIHGVINRGGGGMDQAACPLCNMTSQAPGSPVLPLWTGVPDRLEAGGVARCLIRLALMQAGGRQQLIGRASRLAALPCPACPCRSSWES